MIGDFEYQILSGIISCGKDAYGSPVKKEVENTFQRSVSYGALYTTLSRLEKKGFIKSELKEATKVRGGRAKKVYTVTGLGQSELREKQNLAISMASATLVGGVICH
ncbi:MAG: PadR family transcriptional regulator [Robiginitomaculum sp.]|nr:MAG: PadR family transcriptional regulator [Robiginitomaculum sp.]